MEPLLPNYLIDWLTNCLITGFLIAQYPLPDTHYLSYDFSPTHPFSHLCPSR